MNNQNSKFPKTDGALNPSTPKDIVTGNSAEEAGKIEKPSISGSGKSPSACSLPKWLDTDPAILAGLLQDTLGIMQGAKWFVYVMPVTATNGRTAIRVTISPPLPNTIGIDGALNEQIISINGKAVTDE